MSHYAKVCDGIVTNVIVADQEFIDSYNDGQAGVWIQTSYNTRGGVHYGQDGQPDGGVALRANYASIGYGYDSEHDVFYPPRPKDIYGLNCLSWTLNAPTWIWQPPAPMPDDISVRYGWVESSQTWIQL